MRALAGYRVIASDVLIRHCRVVAVFYRDAHHFQAKAVQLHGPNVTRFQLDFGERLWFIVVFHINPDDVATIKCVVAAISQCPHGAVLLVADDFNVKLAVPEESRHGEDKTEKIATVGLEDLSTLFLP